MRAAGPKKGPPPLIDFLIAHRDRFVSRPAKLRVGRPTASESLRSPPSTRRRDQCRNRHGSACSESRRSPSREIEGADTRVSRLTFEAASPKISAARTRAKRSMRLISSSARLRPETNRSHASAASIICRIRIASSRRILDRGGLQHLIAEVAAEILRCSQVDLPPV